MKTAMRSAPVPTLRAFSIEKMRSYWLLSKPRVTILVWLTTVAGLVLGAWGQSVSGSLILLTLLGSWLVIASANALNQAMEWVQDSQMTRTAGRPIPAGLVRVHEGWIVGVLWGILGVALLALFANTLVALLGLVSILSYAFAYTPLKRYTHLCTAIGAVPGAMPPLAGWVAVTGSVSPEAFLLFIIQYLWQFPHFWAIAWLNREDYARVGFHMLPYAGADGIGTSRLVLWYTLMLVIFSAVMGFYLSKPWLYLVGVVLLGVWHLHKSLQFYRAPERLTARGVLMASVLYLPLLLIWVIISR